MLVLPKDYGDTRNGDILFTMLLPEQRFMHGLTMIRGKNDEAKDQ